MFTVAQDLDNRGLPGSGHGLRRAAQEQERRPRLRLEGEEGGTKRRHYGERQGWENQFTKPMAGPVDMIKPLS